jgi:hypothetical protein
LVGYRDGRHLQWHRSTPLGVILEKIFEENIP